MSVGLLSKYLKTTLKNVQVTNYSITQGRFDFDTSYRFNTQVRNIPSKNLSHEHFIAVPGGGYMLLKEYGMPYESDKTPKHPLSEIWRQLICWPITQKPTMTNLLWLMVII